MVWCAARENMSLIILSILIYILLIISIISTTKEDYYV